MAVSYGLPPQAMQSVCRGVDVLRGVDVHVTLVHCSLACARPRLQDMTGGRGHKILN